MNHSKIIIIGAGAAGLTAAINLQKAGLDFQILESKSHVGGRLATSLYDGYALDHGFQILLTAYPAVKKYINLSKINGRHLKPGAQIFLRNKKSFIADPLRNPTKLFATLLSGIGNIADKLNILRLVTFVKSKSPEQLFDLEEHSTLTFLKNWGFSDGIIDHFFRPFYSGIFLESNLDTSSCFFLFTFKMFAEGSAFLPQNGINTIAQHLADQLDPKLIQTNSCVKTIDGNTITLENNKTIKADWILDTRPPINSPSRKRFWNATISLYYTAPKTNLPFDYISLFPHAGHVRNICVISKPQGLRTTNDQHLLCVSLNAPADKDLDYYHQLAEADLDDYFKEELNAWSPIAFKSVRHSLPLSKNAEWKAAPKKWLISENHLHFGDWRLSPSLQGAMMSGEIAAQYTIEQLK